MPALRITAHARGGVSVYGPGFYEPRANEAIALTREDESLAVTIEYPSAPTAPSVTTSNITSTTPSISGAKLTFTLSAIHNGGSADITATVGGSTSKIRIRALSDTSTDTYANA